MHEADVLRDPGGVPRLARGAPRDREGAPRRLLQEGHRQAEHHLARVGRRGAVLRLDRRRAPEPRRDALHDPLHAARPTSIWSAINVARVAELTKLGRMRAGRPPRVRGADAGADRRLLVRAERGGEAHARAGEDAAREPQGRRVLRRAAALVPAHRDPLGDQRQAGRDARAPPPAAHRRQRGRAEDRAAPAARKDLR